MRRSGTLVLAVALVVGAAACGGDGGQDRAANSGRGRAITVASFGFSESKTIAEIYAQALERRDYPVRRPLGIVSGEVVDPALEQGVVDIVPRYLGSALRALEGEGAVTPPNPVDAYQRLRRRFATRGVTVGSPAPAENKNGLVVLRETAERLDLRRTSDLAPSAPTLVLGGPPECPERPLCLPGFINVYGLRFREFRPLDSGGPLTVGALEGDEVDVAVLFTSDGHLASDDFVLLQDDRSLQPPENVVPAVRNSVVRRHGQGVIGVLDEVSLELDTRELVALNSRVDIDGVSPRRAAADWLRKH